MQTVYNVYLPVYQITKIDIQFHCTSVRSVLRYFNILTLFVPCKNVHSITNKEKQMHKKLLPWYALSKI